MLFNSSNTKYAELIGDYKVNLFRQECPALSEHKPGQETCPKCVTVPLEDVADLVPSRESILDELNREALRLIQTVHFSHELKDARASCRNKIPLKRPNGQPLLDREGKPQYKPCAGCKDCVGQVLRESCANRDSHLIGSGCDNCLYMPEATDAGLISRFQGRLSFKNNSKRSKLAAERKFPEDMQYEIDRRNTEEENRNNRFDTEDPRYDPENVAFGDSDRGGNELGLIDTGIDPDQTGSSILSGQFVEPDLAQLKEYHEMDARDTGSDSNERRTMACPTCKGRETTTTCQRCNGKKEICSDCQNQLPVGKTCGTCGRPGNIVTLHMPTSKENIEMSFSSTPVLSQEEREQRLNEIFGQPAVQGNEQIPGPDSVMTALGLTLDDPEEIARQVSRREQEDNENTSYEIKPTGIKADGNIIQDITHSPSREPLKFNELQSELDRPMETIKVYRKHPDDCICEGTNSIAHRGDLVEAANRAFAGEVKRIKSDTTITDEQKRNLVIRLQNEKYRCREQSQIVDVPSNPIAPKDPDTGKPIFRRIEGI